MEVFHVPMMPSDASCVAAIGCRWMVARIHPHHEKAIAEKLFRAGFGYFLPLVRRETMHNRQKLVKWLPLIPDYVFADVEATDLLRAERRSFMGIIPVSDQKRLVRDLSNLEILVSARPDYGSHDIAAAYRAAGSDGVRVQVVYGPLEGMTGTVLSVDEGRFLVSVGVTLLNTFTTIEIHESKLTILD